MKTLPARRRALRGNPLLREKIHDPYQLGGKLRETTQCPQCGVRYRNGRWTWPKTETRAVKGRHCPACRRINDRYPAGEVVLSGRFLDSHRDEILARVQHVERLERAEHPLHRIMSTDQRDAAIVVRTTDIHLPHEIGHALKDSWGGTLKTQYDLEG